MLQVILIEPELSENTGFTARVMKNFGFENLVLINPKCDLDKAIKTAKHAKDILAKAAIADSSHLQTLDYVIGTTAKHGTDNNIPRNTISIEKLAEKLSKINLDCLNVGLLLGREGVGLSNKEINNCDILVTIPASKKYPVLNVSHAAAVILYELAKKLLSEKSDSHIRFAGKKDLEVIEGLQGRILDKIDFETKEKKDTQKKVWKRIFGKAMLTKREAFSVMGFFRKLLR